jgi:hypothetical protein
MKNYSGKIKAMESSHQRNKHKAVELVLKAVLPA